MRNRFLIALAAGLLGAISMFGFVQATPGNGATSTLFAIGRFDDIDAKALEDLKTQASEHRSVFITRAGPETRARAGEPLEIHVDTRKLYFFDPATGATIYGDPAAVGSEAVARATT